MPKLNSTQVSKCCKGKIKEFYTHKRLADKHYRYFAVQLPLFRDVIICCTCHNECEKVNVLQ